jgi:hypothetical protein
LLKPVADCRNAEGNAMNERAPLSFIIRNLSDESEEDARKAARVEPQEGDKYER